MTQNNSMIIKKYLFENNSDKIKKKIVSNNKLKRNQN